MTRTQMVDVGDADLRVDLTGEGEPLVLLHGFTGSAAAMAPLTERLASTHRLIVPDLVGHGRSSVPTDSAAYTVDAMVEHVLVIAETLDCPEFHLVGYSMGGRVALTLGCGAAARLRSLTLIGTSAGLYDQSARSERRSADELTARLIETDFERFVDEWMSGPLFAGQSRLGEEFLEQARAQRLSSDPSALASSLRAAGTGSMAPVHDRLRECAVPTMMIVGEADQKFRDIAVELSAALPNARNEVVRGAGHAAHVEDPEAVATLIAGFVEEVDRR